MPSTTTIRIEDELKTRLAAAASHAGQTPHAFMLQAIADRVEHIEQEEAVLRVASERWEKLAATGDSVPWDEARTWLEARARGERPSKPRARKGTRRTPG